MKSVYLEVLVGTDHNFCRQMLEYLRIYDCSHMNYASALSDGKQS